MKRKIAKLIIDFYQSKGVKDVFLLTGGAIAFIADEVRKNKAMRYIPAMHEQGAAMMSDGYFRISSRPSLCLATSGPGATNLITGIACSWYDSIPNIFITGQVRSDEIRSLKNKTNKIRQVGFQETDVVSMVKSITKFSYQLKKGDDIEKILNNSFNLALEGRPGPILLDVPIDLQLTKIKKKKFNLVQDKKINKKKLKKKELVKTKSYILNSKKPLILVGGGLRSSKEEKVFDRITKSINIPIVNTWNGFDSVEYKHKNFIGTVGIYGNRAANLAIQNADLVLVLGSRLESRVIGRDKKNFAKKAKIIQVDIDSFELERIRERKINLKINCPINFFLFHLNKEISKKLKNSINNNILLWLNYLKKLKKTFSIPGSEKLNNKYSKVNPYIFFDKLSKILSSNSKIFASTGSTVTWAIQSFKIKKGQRFISAHGHSPMGYALPASIGGCIANRKTKIICIEGDGSFQLNLQELQTMVNFKLPIKIIILNNFGYGIIRQFQDQNLNSIYTASDITTKVKNPDFSKIAKTYNINYLKLNNNNEINYKLKQFILNNKAGILEVRVNRKFEVIPRVQLGGSLDNMHPKINFKFNFIF